MIYLDSSVVLAQIPGEDRRPSEALWQEDLVSSRLLEYEVWVRVHARGLGERGETAAGKALAEIEMYELEPGHSRSRFTTIPGLAADVGCPSSRDNGFPAPIWPGGDAGQLRPRLVGCRGGSRDRDGAFIGGKANGAAR